MRMSPSQFAAVVEEAVRSLPEQFRRRLDNVSVDVLPRPTRPIAEELGLDDASDLLGAYLGVPLTDRSVQDIVQWPERIVVFQHNLERMCRTRQELLRETRKTVLHELAHHFGMDEQDLEGLGYE